ncbi:MAG TPA: AraC family transcriptional regulator [Solirubrobacteraceae bacterium]|nr:AraC family transcriptional regulator [Solirubrobacteraceae bacterium]
MDPLADVLDLSRVRGALLGNVRAGAPWGLALPQSDGASFHAVTSGTAWLRVGVADPIQLMPGDLALLPTGAPHRIASTPDGECRPFDRALKERLMTPEGDLPLDGPGATTTFVCAGYDYDHDIAQPLLALLPPVLHVPADPVGRAPTAALVTLLAGEVGLRNPGARSAVDRLIDLLLIAVVRAWAHENGGGRASWLSALRDPTIARALAALHDRPADAWTLESLAAEVNVSRATLARRFGELVGQPPLAYLTRWRIDLAARRLKDTSEPIDAIARAVGYTSEYAFSRAFRRHRGVPPGRFRRAYTIRLAAGTASSTD